ncbi:MAG: LysM peptidoglycan-binding domain-containing protein [Anaerolineae bacterium]|nr:LysM peptidoglycan-binding domain-containing protein [Anaerolineae bacterium]
MRHPRLWLVALLTLAVAMSGGIAGCTRKRPRPTPMPTMTAVSAPTETPAPPSTPPMTRAATESGAEQPAAIVTPGPASTPVPTASQQEEMANYTVGQGETLFSIAQKLGLDVDELKRLNNLPSDNVTPGQVIKVPASALKYAPTSTPAPGRSVIHVVRRGEYLKLIADKYGVSPEAIIRANHLRNPNVIYPGQKLIIPAPNSTPTAPGGATAPRKVHIVQRGETLQSIALKYGVTVSELAAANGITNPNVIYPGQKLVIP